MVLRMKSWCLVFIHYTVFAQREWPEMYGGWTEIAVYWEFFLGFIWDLWDVLTVHITSLVDAIRILALVRLARPSMLIVPTVLVWIPFKFLSKGYKYKIRNFLSILHLWWANILVSFWTVWRHYTNIWRF